MATIKVLHNGAYHPLNKLNVMAIDEPGIIQNTLNQLALRENEDDGLYYIYYKNQKIGEGLETGPQFGKIVTSLDSLSVAEGQANHFTVKLSKKPTDNQLVELVSNDTNIAIISPAAMTFTPKNWNIEQEVTVATIKDDDDEDEITSISLTTTEDSRTVTVNVTDTDEFFGEIVTSTNKLEINEGESKTFTVSLSRKPTHNQTVSLSSSGSLLSLSPATLTFTPTDWGTAKTVTATCGEDNDTEDKAFAISLTTTNNSKVVNVDMIDNDVPKQPDPDTPGATYGTVSAAPVVMSVKENESIQVTITLSQAPSVRQIVSFSTEHTNLLKISPISVIFTPTDWSPKTITVTALADDDAENSIELINVVSNGSISATLNVNIIDAEGAEGAEGPAEPALPISVYNNRTLDSTAYADFINSKWRRMPTNLRQWLVNKGAKAVLVDPAQDSTVRVRTSSGYENTDFSNNTAAFTYDTTSYYPTKITSLESSVTHELGHIVLNKLAENTYGSFYRYYNGTFKTLMSQEGPTAPFDLDKGHDAMLNYHITNQKEYFAEAFEYIVEARVPVSRWLEGAPRTYQFIKDVIDLKYS